MKTVPFVLEQHAEESAFLWILRDAAVLAPHYLRKDLAKLDARLEAHLDGLRIAGPHGWKVLVESLALKEPGEVFAAGLIAFESGDVKRVENVLEAGTAEPELARGLVSAIGWLPPKKADRLIKSLLASPSKTRRRAGVAGAAVRRLDFEKGFLAAVEDDEPLLRARGLRALAELGMKRHAPLLSRHLGAADPAVGYAAAWGAAVISGEPGAVSSLQAFARGPGRRMREALELAGRRMTVGAAASWREKLASSPETLRSAVILAGASGDPAAVPWLLEKSADPVLARPIGEAISFITGVDLAALDLTGARPPGFKAGPGDDPKDDTVAPDPDENLPWPELPRLQAWWAQNKGRFAPGKRHLLGREISAASAREALDRGTQRQRHAAALELALLEPGTPVVEVRGPAFRA